MSAILTSLVDLMIGLIGLILYSFIIGFPPRLDAFYIFPLMVFFTAFSALGIGLFLSSLNVVFRDVRYALPYFLQILMFVTPIIYPLSIVGTSNREFMAVNPMTTVVSVIRSVFMPQTLPEDHKIV
jgi:lipopolysaccharide transport system permease protein